MEWGADAIQEDTSGQSEERVPQTDKISFTARPHLHHTKEEVGTDAGNLSWKLVSKSKLFYINRQFQKMRQVNNYPKASLLNAQLSA